MKKHQETLTCFVAGTMILTASGLVAIENIKAGDKVISTYPETMETSPKTVLETYIREVTTLVHLTVNGEEIVTTVDHPFYVKNQGFIKAGELIVGDELLDVNGNVLLVENFDVELTDKPVKVYNFQVEDFHTYHVSGLAILVHNAGGYERSQKYSNNWSDESLSKTVDKIAPDSKPVKTSSGKEIYNNPKTGKQVVYDTDGNYFRIEDTTLTGKRVYTDINGNQIPNNKFVNGKQIGISKSEYNQLTHFNNID
ncbi:MAG: polymorphic toxin-type HINT domain-containing protein [Ruminococcus bicirculans (ex Wegman et al. 2014)]|uniref:polymorphic toxin-type HINT domain-containing protein n=1 Tax=Ruminococcus bicirculans (ex Wegman et al. 2014) TaxID=1160721 RepID=UPI003994DC4B